MGIAGLGMIGGSLALALRDAGFAKEILAWDPDPEALRSGLGTGVIDRSADALDALAASVDLLVLAAPTLACDDLLRRVLLIPDGPRIVTDVASVKAPLCRVLDEVDSAAAERVVPGHPIAGSERSGVAAADRGLFRDHRVILTPRANTAPSAIDVVTAMWKVTGARVSTMDIDEHDAVLAATSHLPHVLAYTLVDSLAQSPTSDDIFRFAAGGFRDFTRIASSDPVMWRDIALANGPALLAALNDFEIHLAKLRRAIEDGDAQALERTFRAAKAARDGYLARQSAELTPQEV
ncbi:MAG: prephenate dehydrogenase/arogenate dehydrogenase family protein [Pseudomonadota bacterium]